ncbi:MAG: 50S ribosomal protein L16 [Omnitrophica WOR_2 bacterium GWF2_38_59]|nr:MAG: 50S ribosomal protein L16 [Omnitrophica WOR_2 bacterium GWA2_37_7]OGX25235.1 MAG: 50S ribosomal protein L16 [Omnitrophica WOR_2 bacterium GWF2_38_59]OGX47907.1 MAG: 50S ribosomal protein L16 [Omnitrophica WOR_2 bacterium RIFOXYA2_FULL_38_17]OGX54161.1 MAG: 50S ribosomal protein L16 [Omnitrophica WOR_2 bacterium RIFOXYA12_FULL_38_10]OGX56244.1 MAG: 50S ribosomal protein L16 [Omnitrophica WOR_2 bacterium RIFOXYC2_FULL_38_12]OGX60251.1 MAG: 50S ribosomal protein L16 [Omnitrophica WOR_2 ba
MVLMPRKVKYRKAQKGKNRGIATAGNKIHFGEYGIKALENGFIKATHIEACRIVVARKMKGVGKLWINIFPHKPVTKKPAEVRMGKGKGDVSHWVSPVKRGKVIFEMSGVPEEFAKTVLRIVSFKLPIKTKFVTRIGH